MGEVRLVRACGSKLSFLMCSLLKGLVRLVRACGSKPVHFYNRNVLLNGQARKSLWIETGDIDRSRFKKKVRLVRACGSKPIEEA